MTQYNHIMKTLVLALLLVAAAAENLLVTPEYTQYLKATVDWEVADYEENVFKGWTVEEFQVMLGDQDSDTVPQGKLAEVEATPSSISWTGANCIHEIHNQGSCGSCWAFATASVTSDRCCLQNKDYGWLAPQELVSCDKANSGCNGGLAAEGLKYVQKNGLVPEACYPYVARGEACPNKCKDGSDWAAAHVCKCKTVVDCGGEALMKSCLTKGPIAVRMKVYQDFTSYKSGVYCWDQRSGFLGGHAIRCTGYSDKPKPSFHCANSWGTAWGVQGYFDIAAKEECGIRLTPHDAWTVEGC